MPPKTAHIDHQLWKDSSKAHFHRWAESYDRDIINVLLFEPCYRRVLSQIRSWQRQGAAPRRMLDVGCGTGSLAVKCLDQTAIGSIVGLDMSENMIRKGAEKARCLELEDRLSFVIGDSEHLPFRSGAFELVTCCNSFHHYPHQQRAIEEMFRVLAPGGRLILIDGCRDLPIGWFIFDVCVTRWENHVHHCSAGRFRDLLATAGFADIRQQVFGICPPALFNLAVAQPPSAGL